MRDSRALCISAVRKMADDVGQPLEFEERTALRVVCDLAAERLTPPTPAREGVEEITPEIRMQAERYAEAEALRNPTRPDEDDDMRADAELAALVRAIRGRGDEDTRRLDWLTTQTQRETHIMPPGNHGGDLHNWLLVVNADDYRDEESTVREYEAPTLRAAIDAATHPSTTEQPR